MKECPVCSRCFPDQVNHCPGDGESLKSTLHGDTVLDGRYQLEKRLGQGGMGIVFKARHIFLKTQHAIKVILPDLVGNDPTLATRFRQEAMAAAAIQHPNTVSVTDYGVIDGTMPFLVMEFIEGRSLHDVVQAEGKLHPLHALEIALAICAGVGAAHSEEIVHRDLKPLNIILKNGMPPSAGLKVLDFGLAKIKSGELLGSFVAAQTQGMMGSPYYMAPEQWSDEDIDRRADIYSIGVILYQMLVGEVPFKGTSVPSIMNKHLTKTPDPLHDRGVFVPPELERAVRHALEKDAAARPQSMEEFVAELQEAAAAVRASEAAARNSDIGMQTVKILPGDATTGLAPGPATTHVADQPRGVGQSTVADTRAVAQTNVLGEEKQAQAPPDGEGAAASNVSKVTRPLADSSFVPPAADASRGAETAHQRANATGGADERGAGTIHGEAPTVPLDTSDEARHRANVGRDLQAEEARAREAEEALVRESEAARVREIEEARAREAEQARAREAEAARLREEEEGRRREAEDLRRRQEEEEKAAALNVSGAAGVGAAGAGAEAVGTKGLTSQTPPVGASQPPTTGAGTTVGTTTSTRPRVPLAAVVAAVVLLLVGGVAVLAYFVVPKLIAAVGGTGTDPTPTPSASPAASPGASPAGESFKPELVALPGGTYLMGRAEVPPVSDQFDRGYLLWVYNQWPAHAVTVGAFEIDKTEVTNAEYAAFVREEGHPAPPGWSGDAPPAGSERLPVANVSYEDALKFAAWRSARDRVTYRLPTEEEWEYAARGGNSQRAYPWGDEWEASRGNLNASAPKPVGSFPAGRTAQGVEDMIGNVWEWTSTTAAMYKGNNRTRLEESDRGKLVVRGGSYESTHAGNEPVTVTARRWVARDFRDPVLGFRLVRAAGAGG